MTQPLQERDDAVAHYRHDHEALRRILGDTCRSLVQRQEPVARVASVMESVHEHLVGHFKQEEGGGFFGKVVEQAPHLSDRTRLLETEHSRLLEESSALVDLARTAGGTDAWWAKLQVDFLEFSKDMIKHESKENELLQEAYGEDMGSYD